MIYMPNHAGEGEPHQRPAYGTERYVGHQEKQRDHQHREKVEEAALGDEQHPLAFFTGCRIELHGERDKQEAGQCRSDLCNRPISD